MSGSINKHGNFTPGEGHNFIPALSAPSQRVRAQLRRTRVITESPCSSRVPGPARASGRRMAAGEAGASPDKGLTRRAGNGAAFRTPVISSQTERPHGAPPRLLLFFSNKRCLELAPSSPTASLSLLRPFLGKPRPPQWTYARTPVFIFGEGPSNALATETYCVWKF